MGRGTKTSIAPDNDRGVRYNQEEDPCSTDGRQVVLSGSHTRVRSEADSNFHLLGALALTKRFMVSSVLNRACR